MHHRTLATALVGLAAVIGCRTYNYASPLGRGTPARQPRPLPPFPSRARPVPASSPSTCSTPSTSTARSRCSSRARLAGRRRDRVAGNGRGGDPAHRHGARDVVRVLSRKVWPRRPAAISATPSCHGGPSWQMRRSCCRIGAFRGSERIATAATILVGGTALPRVQACISGPRWRSDRARAATKCGRCRRRGALRRVVVGGDMNSRGVGEEFRAARFCVADGATIPRPTSSSTGPTFSSGASRPRTARRRRGARYARRQ